MKKNILAVTLAVIFVMALAVPAFAQSMTHSIEAEMDATSIDWTRQSGHLCNTGAEAHETIMGSGQLSKSTTTAMVKGRITVDNTNDFIAGATPLTVTSAILLCAPPKYLYEDEFGFMIPVHPQAIYNHEPHPRAVKKVYTEPLFPVNRVAEAVEGGWGLVEHGTTPAHRAAAYNWEPVSMQIWAAQVQADPGFSGSLHQDWEAAYGPYAGFVDEDTKYWEAAPAGQWGWTATGPATSSTFVGDYFLMDQFLRTSQGTVSRFIDISSPWSGAYVHEDSEFVGHSEISDDFRMVNLAAGADTVTDWWDIF